MHACFCYVHNESNTPHCDSAYLGLNGLHLGGTLQLRVGQRIRENLEQESEEHDGQAE